MKYFILLSTFQFYFASQITDIKIIGNKYTQNSIILREIHQDITGKYDSTLAIEDRNRLYNLGLFSTVNINLLDSTYTINLVETFHYYPLPIIEYDESKGWSYGLGIAFLNFNGLNQKLIIGGILGQETTYFIDFNDPWIIGNHVSLSSSIYKFNTQNPIYLYNYLEKGINIGTSLYYKKNHKFKFLIGFENISIDTTNLTNKRINYNLNNLLNKYQYIRSDLGYIYDKRDIFLDPTSGEKISFYFKPKFSMENSDHYYQFLFIYTKYFLLLKTSLEPVLSAQSKIYLKYSKTLPIFEYQYLGGEDFVRGYSPLPDENSNKISHLIEGFNIIYQSFQLQHTLLSKKDYSGVELGIDIVYFTDFGITSNTLETMKMQNILIGYGCGFRFFISGAGVIKIDFGFNPYGEKWLLHPSDDS